MYLWWITYANFWLPFTFNPIFKDYFMLGDLRSSGKYEIVDRVNIPGSFFKPIHMYKYSYSAEIFKRINEPIIILFPPSNDTLTGRK